MLPAQFGDEKDLSVSLLKAVLRASANLIDLMYCSHDTILTIGKLVRTLLDSGQKGVAGFIFVSKQFRITSLLMIKNVEPSRPTLFLLKIKTVKL